MKTVTIHDYATDPWSMSDTYAGWAEVVAALALLMALWTIWRLFARIR